MTILAVAIAGAAGAIAGYIAEEHEPSAELLSRRALRTAVRAFSLGFIAAIVLIKFVFTDVSDGEILADLASGYICGDVAAAVMRRSEHHGSAQREGLVQPLTQLLAGCTALLLGAAVALSI